MISKNRFINKSEHWHSEEHKYKTSKDSDILPTKASKKLWYHHVRNNILDTLSSFETNIQCHYKEDLTQLSSQLGISKSSTLTKIQKCVL